MSAADLPPQAAPPSQTSSAPPDLHHQAPDAPPPLPTLGGLNMQATEGGKAHKVSPSSLPEIAQKIAILKQSKDSMKAEIQLLESKLDKMETAKKKYTLEAKKGGVGFEKDPDKAKAADAAHELSTRLVEVQQKVAKMRGEIAQIKAEKRELKSIIQEKKSAPRDTSPLARMQEKSEVIKQQIATLEAAPKKNEGEIVALKKQFGALQDTIEQMKGSKTSPTASKAPISPIRDLEQQAKSLEKELEGPKKRRAELSELKNKGKATEEQKTEFNAVDSKILALEKRKNVVVCELGNHWVDELTAHPKEGTSKLKTLNDAMHQTSQNIDENKKSLKDLDSQIDKLSSKTLGGLLGKDKEKEAKKLELENKRENLQAEQSLLKSKELALKQAVTNETRMNDAAVAKQAESQKSNIYGTLSFPANDPKAIEMTKAINEKVVGNPTLEIGKVFSDITRLSDRMTIVDERVSANESHTVKNQFKPDIPVSLPDPGRVSDLETTLSFLDKKGSGEGKLTVSREQTDAAISFNRAAYGQGVTTIGEDKIQARIEQRISPSAAQERAKLSPEEKAKADAKAKGKQELNESHLRELRSCTQQIYSGLLNDKVLQLISPQRDSNIFTVVADMTPKSIVRTVKPDGSTEVTYNMEFDVVRKDLTVTKNVPQKDGSIAPGSVPVPVEKGVAVMTVTYDANMTATSVKMDAQAKTQ